MPSNLYLFDPAQAQSNAGEKPLIQLVRDAEIARAEESARIFKGIATRLSGLFRAGKPEAVAKTAAEPATKLARTPANEDRLAA